MTDEITFEFAADEGLLFSVESVAMDSPRLAWIKRHQVFTHFCEESDMPPWCAWFGKDDPSDFLNEHGDAFGYGDEEDDAIAALARQEGWRLWNEETT